MILQKALSDEGYSGKNLTQFIEDMKNKILQKQWVAHKSFAVSLFGSAQPELSKWFLVLK